MITAKIVEYIEVRTAAQLIAAIERLGAGILDLDTVYLKDANCEDLSQVALEQETLSDGSTVFNLILSDVGDPNS